MPAQLGLLYYRAGGPHTANRTLKFQCLQDGNVLSVPSLVLRESFMQGLCVVSQDGGNFRKCIDVRQLHRVYGERLLGEPSETFNVQTVRQHFCVEQNSS